LDISLLCFVDDGEVKDAEAGQSLRHPIRGISGRVDFTRTE
jgi:hypothetical protein